MVKSIALSGLLVASLLVGAGTVQAGIFRHRQTQSSGVQQTTAPRAATATNQGSNYSTNRPASVWPVYPNYGNNPVGAAYSAAAGMRPGQFFGTFGLRPADARARGAY
jgi:hypothetical protein